LTTPLAPGGSTRLFAVLGDPVEHSRSPAIHNPLLRARGRDALYLALRAPAGSLATVLPALSLLPFDGANLTTPFKEEAVPLCASLGPRARVLGAVNTLVRDGDGWRGHQTDGDGLLLWLREEGGLDPAGRRVVVLGAGGAARAAVLALMEAGPEDLVVVTRRRARFGTAFFRQVRVRGVRTLLAEGREAVRGALAQADLLVHATPFGLGASGEGTPEPPWPLGDLAPGAVVVDMNYRIGAPTPFLSVLGDRPGLHDGRGMLAGQALLAFELWTGERPSLAETLAAGGLGPP